MNHKTFRPPNIQMPKPAKTADADQLREELQRAFDKVSKRIGKVEARLLAHDQLFGMIFTMLIEHDMIEADQLVGMLNSLKADATHDGHAATLDGIIGAITTHYADDQPKHPHLKILPDPTDRPDKSDP